jgi:hypothetical protein
MLGFGKCKKGKGTRNRPEGPEGVRGIPILFLDLGAGMGWVVSTTPRPLYPRERPGTHCTGGWVGPRAGLDVCEKFVPTEIRSPDRPARSQSLYRLSYPGPFGKCTNFLLAFTDRGFRCLSFQRGVSLLDWTRISRRSRYENGYTVQA